MGSRARVWLWGIDLANTATDRDQGDGFGPLGADEAAGLAAAMGLSISEVSARLTWSRCHVGRDASRIACYCWVSRVETPIGEIDVTIEPNPGEVYIWDCATLPEYRRRGFFTRMLRHLVAALAAENLRRAWIGTVEDNPAISAFDHAGFHLVLRVGHSSPEPAWAVEPAAGASPDEVEALRVALKIPQNLPFSR